MSSTHADSSDDKLTDAKQTIATMLANDHKGKASAISSKRLAEAVGLKPTTVRDLIPEIRREYLLPVVSNGNGYYVIQSQEEFTDVLTRINKTIETKHERRQDIVKAWRGEQ